MADLSESSTFPSGIYQLEKSDPVVGGPPDLEAGEGLSNVQAQQLASRTRWLKDEIADRTAPAALLAEIKTVDGAGSGLDADTLDGKQASEFLLVGGKAADADKLDGKDASEFLLVGAKAADADTLDGKHASDFLPVGAKAVDANKLDGFDSSQFVRSDVPADFDALQITATGISLSGEIGATAWLRLANQTDAITYGQTFAGGALRTAGLGLIIDGSNGNQKSSGPGVAPNGTWRAMGSCDSGTERYASTIFVRIS